MEKGLLFSIQTNFYKLSSGTNTFVVVYILGTASVAETDDTSYQSREEHEESLRRVSAQKIENIS